MTTELYVPKQGYALVRCPGCGSTPGTAQVVLGNGWLCWCNAWHTVQAVHE